MQAYRGTALATLKLHYALHHVGDQMACLGHLDKFQEYWVERMVHELKALTRGNASRNAEVTFVKVLLCARAAASSRCACPLACMGPALPCSPVCCVQLRMHACRCGARGGERIRRSQ